MLVTSSSIGLCSLILLCLKQLVCFYFVLTTFTTVGYGVAVNVCFFSGCFVADTD